MRCEGGRSRGEAGGCAERTKTRAWELRGTSFLPHVCAPNTAPFAPHSPNAAAAAEKGDAAAPGGQLVQAEGRETGSIQMRVFIE